MNVWLVKLEEQLPIDEPYRPYRIGLLEEALVKRGHHVTRWCSDLNHHTGEYRFGKDTTVEFASNQSFEILNSGIRYIKPVSPLRLLDNYYLAFKFKRRALKSKLKPDLIVCAMPTPELARATADIAMHFKIPYIIDARDYWPEIFDSELSGLKRLLAGPIIYSMRKNLHYACVNASSLIGITEFYRDHLLKYSGRSLSAKDGVFYLGFNASLNQLSDSEIVEAKDYWKSVLKLDLDTESKKIIYFAGRFNRTVFNAIEPVRKSAEYFQTNCSEYVFVLCGSGQFSNQIIEKLQGLGNVVLPGEVSSKNLSYLRRKSFIALQPIENRIDYLNSLSNKFFENISSGLPIVTSLKGVTQQVIEKEKIGFSYKNQDELIEYLKMLASEIGIRDEISKRANDVFVQNYSSEVVYEKIADHCEIICKKLAS
jgi:glycosyltransferase involved in cell wall biosynthesis